MDKKWIVIVILAIAVFVLWTFLCSFVGAKAKFFFEDWKVEWAVETRDGLVQVKLTNPDLQAKVKSVETLLAPKIGTVAYWFWDEQGDPQMWIKGKDGYFKRNAEGESGCIRCHPAQAKTPA